MKNFLALCISVLSYYAVQAYNQIEVLDDNIVFVGNNLEYLFEKEGEQIDYNQVRLREFMKIESNFPEFGITDEALWLKLKLKNSSQTANLLLDFSNPMLDSIIVINHDEREAKTVGLNIHQKISERSIAVPTYLVPVTVNPGSETTLFFRVKNNEKLSVPISIGTEERMRNFLYDKDFFSGIYFGIVVVMILYNLFIYFSVRDSSYLYYIFYILTVGLTQAAISGYGHKYLWASSATFNQFSIFIFGSFSGISTLLFFRRFVNVRYYYPKVDWLLLLFVILDLFAVVLVLLGYYKISYQIIDGVAAFGSFVVLIVGVLLIRKGSREAKYFLIAYSFFLVSVIIYVLKGSALIPYNNFSAHILQFGSGIEIILLSLVLADKINVLKRENEQSQKRALKISRQNEKIVKDQNQMLEKKVGERTFELREANSNLSKALNDLKSAQTQLVQQEKMYSLGQLTAGIAHEINNPINFVTSNVMPLKRDIEDLIEVFNEYEKIENQQGFEQAKQEIESLKEEIELDYVMSEISQLLEGINDGARRTAEIVRGLKVFSRMDEQDLKMIDISEGLESTLTLLNSSMKGIVTIEKQFDQVSRLECYAGKLNQVFMNLLNNSIQAVKTRKEKENIEGLITLTLKEEKNEVVFTLSDNGVGMSEEVKKKMFEPFFTTKEVGEGTGLGMSITLGIIEQHNGRIICESRLGEGTTFTINLPLKQ